MRSRCKTRSHFWWQLWRLRPGSHSGQCKLCGSSPLQVVSDCRSQKLRRRPPRFFRRTQTFGGERTRGEILPWRAELVSVEQLRP